MTQMSDLPLTDPRNHAGLPVARALHRGAPAVKLVAAALLLAAAQACVIPPSLAVGAEDAAVNSPPSITSVRVDGTEFTSPESLVFPVADTETMTIGVLDTDLNDTLYVRLFVDYATNPLGARSQCEAPPSATAPTAARTTNCDLTALCTPSDLTSTTSSLTPHDLNIVVFDRQPSDSGSPPPAFQAMVAGGLSTQQYFHLNCEAAAP
jgi:hypothetical protein